MRLLITEVLLRLYRGFFRCMCYVLITSLLLLFSNIQDALQSKDDIIHQLRKDQKKVHQPPHSFHWRQRRDMPIAEYDARSVVIEGKVYVGKNEHIVQVYDIEEDEWSRLPRCPVRLYGVTAVNNQLVLAGGQDSDNKASNQIRVWDGRSWTTPYPPMPTARYSATAIRYQQFLVVAGGSCNDRTVVEILDTVTKQWHTATPLPVGCYQLTSAVVDDTLYLLGGYSGGSPNKRVFGISLPTLICRATTPSATRQAPAPTWERLPDTPFNCSTAVSVNNSLLAVGGKDDSMKHSSAVHLYNFETKEWLMVGDLPVARRQCTCTTLPSEELLVLGGWGENNKHSNEVYVATVNE